MANPNAALSESGVPAHVRRHKRPHSKGFLTWLTAGVFAAFGFTFLALAANGVIPGVFLGSARQNAGENSGLASREILQVGTIKHFTMEEALHVKGLYVTMDTFGTPSRIASIFDFIQKYKGINALVVDVKDNSGRVPCKMGDNIVSPSAGYEHFKGLVQVLKQEGYYLIARIVVFQDPYMARTKPEQAIRRSDGSLWKDNDGRLWLNPYDRRNWEYVRDLALWAQGIGFDEIQLDYVRFPDGAQNIEKSGKVIMPGSEGYKSRSDAIVAFLNYMREALQGKAYLSADIFGFTTIAQDDMGIGQKIEDVASAVDFICPMVYPSHYYNPGIYGFEVPEAHPGEVVSKAMDQALERTKGLRAKIRPWLQDFSLKIRYGKAEVQAQIDAVSDHDIHTFLLWNPANSYTPGVDFEK